MKKIITILCLISPIYATADYYFWGSMYSSETTSSKQIDRHKNNSSTNDTVTLSGTVSWNNSVTGSGSVSAGVASSQLSITAGLGVSITKSVTYTLSPGQCKAIYGEAIKNYKRKYHYKVYTATDTTKKVGTASGNKYTSNGTTSKSC